MNRFARPAVVLALLLAAGAVSPVLAQRPNIAAATDESRGNALNNPALKGLNIPRTGRPGRIGVLTTKTLLIAGEGGMNTTPKGQGAMLRAYNKATGEDVGAVYMPAPQTGSPMTYLLDGQQYITVSISAAGFPGELIAYKLPK